MFRRPGVLDEQVDTIGQFLANWSTYHHQIIKINGKPVNIEGGNAGGYSPVVWQLKNGDPLAWQNRIVRENLKQILEQSNCNLKEITSYLKQFVSVEYEVKAYQDATPEKIAKELNCLGKVEFEKASWDSC